MTAVKAIQDALESTKGFLNWYVADFTDADLLVRPIPNANHAAWQIGNVIVGDVFLLRSELPNATLPQLPAGFMEQHGKEGAADDNAAHFMTKAQYLKLFAEVRDAVIAELGKLCDADLDRESTSDMKSFAPTIGKLFQAISDHTMMHVGQFSVIRRKLGKPVLF